MEYPSRMPTEWTAEMVRALPDDGKRHELLDGELVMRPAPRRAHQAVAQALFKRLDSYVEAHRLGDTYVTVADIEFSPRRLVQPDLFVVPLAADGTHIDEWEKMKELLLVVEVLSPSTARYDRVKKRTIYLEEGVPEYWIVDVDARCIERWRTGDSGPTILDEDIAWQPSANVPACEINLVELFEQALT